MKIYKFRGVTFDGLTVFGTGVYVSNHSHYIIDKRKFIKVKPDSVRQLIAFDDNHNELFQGDVVYHDFNPNDLTSYAATPYSVELDTIFIDNYGKHYYLPKGFVCL